MTGATTRREADGLLRHGQCSCAWARNSSSRDVLSKRSHTRTPAAALSLTTRHWQRAALPPGELATASARWTAGERTRGDQHGRNAGLCRGAWATTVLRPWGPLVFLGVKGQGRFYRLKVCGNPAWSKSIRAIFPQAQVRVSVFSNNVFFNKGI